MSRPRHLPTTTSILLAAAVASIVLSCGTKSGLRVSISDDGRDVAWDLDGTHVSAFGSGMSWHTQIERWNEQGTPTKGTASTEWSHGGTRYEVALAFEADEGGYRQVTLTMSSPSLASPIRAEATRR